MAADAERPQRGSMSSALAAQPTVAQAQPRLELVGSTVRQRLVDASALLEAGDVAGARRSFSRALTAADDECDDAARAEAHLGLGTCLYHDGELATADEALSLALVLCREAGTDTRLLQARILDRRSRCHCRERRFGAARADVEAGLALIDNSSEPELAARLTLQASLIAERTGQTLVARCLAEQAHDLLVGLGDRRSLARVLNNLGGLNHLLGDHGYAATLLRRAHEEAVAAGSRLDAAQALSSLAQVEVALGLHEEAEAGARSAIVLLEAHTPFADELGNATLVLARALRGTGRIDEAVAEARRAGAIFRRLGIESAYAATLVLEGDLARDRGDCATAATLYRDAAECLQNFHF